MCVAHCVQISTCSNRYILIDIHWICHKISHFNIEWFHFWDYNSSLWKRIYRMHVCDLSFFSIFFASLILPSIPSYFNKKKNCVAFFALRINTCVCNIFHVLCSHAFELDVCYVWQAKHNVTWKICRKKIESNGMPVRSLFVSIWFTYVSRRLLVLCQRQNINSNTKQYNNWLIFPKENEKNVKMVGMFLEYRMLCYETVIQYLGTKEN